MNLIAIWVDDGCKGLDASSAGIGVPDRVYLGVPAGARTLRRKRFFFACILVMDLALSLSPTHSKTPSVFGCRFLSLSFSLSLSLSHFDVLSLSLSLSMHVYVCMCVCTHLHAHPQKLALKIQGSSQFQSLCLAWPALPPACYGVFGLMLSNPSRYVILWHHRVVHTHYHHWI